MRSNAVTFLLESMSCHYGWAWTGKWTRKFVENHWFVGSGQFRFFKIRWTDWNHELVLQFHELWFVSPSCSHSLPPTPFPLPLSTSLTAPVASSSSFFKTSTILRYGNLASLPGNSGCLSRWQQRRRKRRKWQHQVGRLGVEGMRLKNKPVVVF